MDSFLPYAAVLLIVGLFTYQRVLKTNTEAKTVQQKVHPQIDMALSLADENTSEEGIQPASTEMLDRLRDKGIVFERTLTIDEASHLLDLFSPPSGRQIDILKHFHLHHSQDMNKTAANFYIREIFKDPENIERWNRRPPTSRIQQAILFMSGQTMSGLTYVEAQSKLTELGMQKPMRYQTWKRMERLYFESNSPELLKKYNARKITWKHFFKVHDALVASGLSEDDIDGATILQRVSSEKRSALSEPVAKMEPANMSLA